MEEIEGETSGDYVETIKGLLMSPRDFDVHQLNSAMKVGTTACTNAVMAVQFSVVILCLITE